MSQKNVEVVQRHVEAWNRRDLGAYLATFASDAEIDWSRSRGPHKGVYRGHGEIKAFWDVWWSTFEDVQLETTHGFVEAGSEVVYSQTTHIRGREGIEVSARSTFLFTVEGGLITRFRMFDERAEALEAAGLSE
jgi:ketosteroid isomerase-like protein